MSKFVDLLKLQGATINILEVSLKMALISIILSTKAVVFTTLANSYVPKSNNSSATPCKYKNMIIYDYSYNTV
jgi:predicted transglutaminase-like protease